MRLLVLGGTVFLSRAVAQAAVTAGDEVICAARGKQGTPPDGARFVHLDRADPRGYGQLTALGHVDAVLDVSSTPSQVRGALAAMSGQADHWIYVSSASVYEDSATPAQRATDAPVLPAAPPEIDDPTQPDTYGPCKVACEHAVIEAMGAEHSFICRAGLIVGPGDPSGRFTAWPARFARGGTVLAPGAPDDPVQWIDVRDLAAWLVDVARTRVAGIFDGICPPVGRGAFLAGVAAGADVEHPDIVWVDGQFLLDHEVNPWAGPRSLPLWLPLPEYAGFLSRDVSASVAAGLSPRDVADTSRATLAWLRDHPPAESARTAGLTPSDEQTLLSAWQAAQP
jgi:2'-hydroxyisoflavone reductase